LEVIEKPEVYEELESLEKMLEDGLTEVTGKYGMKASINRPVGALTNYYKDRKLTDYNMAEESEGEGVSKVFNGLIQRAINIAPSKYEAWFLRTEHTEDDIRETLSIVEEVFKNDL